MFGVLLLGCLYVWFVGWLVGLFLGGGLVVDCLVVWLFACLVLCCLVVQLFGGLVACLVCCFGCSLGWSFVNTSFFAVPGERTIHQRLLNGC